VVGNAGGNDALYQQMEDTRARVSADAAASERQLQRTIARAQSGSLQGSNPDTIPSRTASLVS